MKKLFAKWLSQENRIIKNNEDNKDRNTMKIEILYFADFKDITGKEREIVELDDDNRLKEVIRLLMKKYPNLEKLLWNENTQDLNENISIMLNHEAQPSNASLSITLSDGDKIAFLLPISGG